MSSCAGGGEQPPPRQVGLRNWRGEIIQPATAACSPESDANKEPSTAHESRKTEPRSPPSDARRPVQKRALRKDEFGRDVEVVVEEKHRKKAKVKRKEDRKKERKHKHKQKYKQHRDKRSNRSKSLSLRGRLVGTPPPADPFRPQLDEDRCRRSQRHKHHRSRSRSIPRRGHHRSRSRGVGSPRTDGHRHRPRRSSLRSRSRSRVRSRSRSRSRSPPSSRSHRRRSSASLERKWTHNAFDDRSPSPARQVDPLYRPEPETWVSRAGGVYLPRK